MNFKRAAFETLLAAITATLISLFAVVIFAVVVRAYAPSDVTVFLVNQIIKCAAAWIASLLFVRRERALFKGAAAGVLGLFLTTLLFGAIGGFHLGPFFLAELLLSALFGGLGGVCGVKLRKE